MSKFKLSPSVQDQYKTLPFNCHCHDPYSTVRGREKGQKYLWHDSNLKSIKGSQHWIMLPNHKIETHQSGWRRRTVRKHTSLMKTNAVSQQIRFCLHITSKTMRILCRISFRGRVKKIPWVKHKQVRKNDKRTSFNNVFLFRSVTLKKKLEQKDLITRSGWVIRSHRCLRSRKNKNTNTATRECFSWQ